MKQPAFVAAQWRLDQCRKTVREGEEELRRRREALRQAEIAMAELKRPATDDREDDSWIHDSDMESR